MHKELVVKTPSLAASSELLVIAPIKPGLVPALDAVTYTSRARMLLRALHTARKNAHEYNLFRAVSDAVERVGVIHTLRVAVLDPDAASPHGSILLSVNFDGSYEAYVRTIWQKSSRLLDLIFCNTAGHVTGWDHSYEAWSRWLQSRQVDTPFYYGTPSLTKGDMTVLRMQDRFQRREADVDLMTTRSAIADAEHIAWELVENDFDPQSGKFAQAPNKAFAAGEREGIRQGLQGLAGVYRLAELYSPADPADGELLRRASDELLPEFARMFDLDNKYGHSIREAAGGRLDSALRWFAQRPVLPAVRKKPALPDAKPAFPPHAQAGILEPVENAQCACVCLVAFDGPAAAAAFMRAFVPTSVGVAANDGLVVNVALTFEGLRASGVPESVLDQLPIEFRQGMQRRAGLLGDVHANHPRRWSLPVANWPQAVLKPRAATASGAPTVPLDAVHALVHLRSAGPSENEIAAVLKQRFDALLDAGLCALSVQWLRREFRKGDDGKPHVVDHFGYADGGSDPTFAPDDAYFFPNQVHLGEALLGHPNAADAEPDLGTELLPLLQNASYLVVRKLRQDVDAFEAVVGAAGLNDTKLVKAKLMGRWPDGKPLIPDHDSLNDFNYDDDTLGAVCPFAAHIRRANPRISDGNQPDDVKAVPGARPPRLFRRGMSYTDPQAGGSVEKGLFFMAFNASIGEQFEVVQRWLAGGNSSGAPSGASDPICGIPEAGRQRHFRFEHEDEVFHLPLDGDDELGVEATPLVQLAWGAYFLAPSTKGLEHLATLADRAAGAAPPVAWSVEQGELVIKRLQALDDEATAEIGRLGKDSIGPARKAALDAWKTVLEDPESRREFVTASVWAAIRHQHAGLLRSTYGVLVADDRLVNEVLGDPSARYSVREYQKRLDETIGPIFLGLDAGAEYDRQATACNEAIEQIEFKDGYELARKYARERLDQWVQQAAERAAGYGESRWELNLEIREVNEYVLAQLLRDWFGLDEKEAPGLLVAAGFDWACLADDAPARYPGAFYTPSRYTFQPQPTAAVERLAKREGQHLRKKTAAYLQAVDVRLKAPVTRAVLDALKQASGNGSTDYDLAARTIAGAIMGFVPTTDNNLRRVVDEWLRDQTLWRLRARIPADSLASHDDGKRALIGPLMQAMMLRPMPEFIWRTAVIEHPLTKSDGSEFLVKPDDRVVLGLISATHQGLERGEQNVVPVFGGDRWAEPAPRHACPARRSAMGVMAGILSAIVDSRYALRPATVGALLSFEGPVAGQRRAPVPKPASARSGINRLRKLERIKELGKQLVQAKKAPPVSPSPAAKTSGKASKIAKSKIVSAGKRVVAGYAESAALKSLRERLLRERLSSLSETKGTMLAWGDSWLHLNHPFSAKEWDLARSLARLGWDTDGFSTHSNEGLTLREMSQVGRRKGFYRSVHLKKPKAILIDGGGNDVHQSVSDRGSPWYPDSPLHKLAAPAGSNPPLVADEVKRFVHVQLRECLDTVLRNLIDVTRGAIPIFVIGYDHPIPDGRTFLFGDSWLDPVNDRDLYDIDQGRDVMLRLIDELNVMIGRAVAAMPGQGLHHLNLTGTLAKQPGYDPDFDLWWLNELHPTEEGHDALAAVIDREVLAVLKP